MSSQAPTFNLKAVIKETGLKPDTLRAWERRYGLPQPERTGSGHRLYSQRDIETIKWLIERQNEGLSIGRAVDLWRMQEAEGQDPLAANLSPHSVLTKAAIALGETVVQLRRTWVEACLAFDEARADYILTQAFALYPAEIVCLELIQRGIAEIGQKWYQGEATVQQEHFASALGTRRLETLIAATATPSRSGRILIGCPPGELHTFGPLLATLLLRRHGWETIYLGANVPLEHLGRTLKTIKPHLVILASQQLRSAAALLEAAQLLQQEQTLLGFGGRIFNAAPSLRQRIPGYFLGEELDALPQHVEKLFSTPYRPDKAEPAPTPHRKALVYYQEKQGMIEAAVWEQVKAHNGHQALVATWHQELAANITAALTLDAMALLRDEIAWGKDLLANHHLPEETLSSYLKAYQQAAGAYLDERAQPILEGLAQLMVERQ